jgi:transcriptional regulator with GAF, ATPase, and Fis domain
MLWGRLERRADPQDDEWSKRLTRSVALCEHVGDRAGTAEALLETALGERARGRRGSAMRAWRLAHALLEQGGGADLRARADLVRGRIDSDRASPEALAAVVRFHAYSRTSGRRDYQAAAAFALARARLRSGDRDGAAAALREAVEVEDDLTASLPPALRRVREAGPAGGMYLALRDEIEAALPPGTAREGTSLAATSEEDMDQERLIKLLEINKQLNQAQDMRALLDTIMDVATTTTGAERGFLILVDDGKISFQTARNFRREEVKKPELKISSSLVRRVMKSGSPILTDNATEDERFAEFQSVERLELKSIVSVPFRSGDAVMGAMYLDNPARKGAFGPGDLQFLQALSDQAAIAIRNLRHANEMAELNRQLEKNLERKSVQLEVASRALAGRATKHPYDDIIGESPQLREVLLLVDKVVDTDVPVLIQGESGTGKELIARAIHRFGRRRDGPFVPVNCGAITETLMESELFGHAKGSFTGAITDKKGLFETANGGTIFLDEIGEMSVDMQKKLLRVLQERELRPVGGKGSIKVDVRVISATNRNLRQMMHEGKFREDLYYRVAVINVDMPPLRERKGDVPLLLDFCVKKAARDMGLVEKPIDPAAMSALVAYSWPGNVRELDNEVKKALTLSEERITIDDLSEQIQTDHPGEEPELVAADAGKTLKESLEKTEKALIEKALEKTGGNQTRAAKELGISRVWLRKKMEKYGLFAAK